MQISTLNKIVNLSIVGSFIFPVLGFLNYTEVISFMASDKLKSMISTTTAPFVIFIITLMFFSSAIFTGLIIESLASIIRSVMKAIYENQLLLSLLRCPDQADVTSWQRAKFYEILLGSNKYKRITGEANHNKPLAIALLFHGGKTENIDFAVQHYSMYLLSTNFVVVLWLGLIFLLFTSHTHVFVLSYSAFVAIITYLLLHTAIDAYFHTYEITFRHACILLSEEGVPATDLQPGANKDSYNATSGN